MDLHDQGRSLTELKGIGPFIAKELSVWLEKELRGDMQMHTHWSDGSGSAAEMARAANECEKKSMT